jgi:hypothetical protein
MQSAGPLPIPTTLYSLKPLDPSNPTPVARATAHVASRCERESAVPSAPHQTWFAPGPKSHRGGGNFGDTVGGQKNVDKDTADKIATAVTNIVSTVVSKGHQTDSCINFLSSTAPDRPAGTKTLELCLKTADQTSDELRCGRPASRGGGQRRSAIEMNAPMVFQQATI